MRFRILRLFDILYFPVGSLPYLGVNHHLEVSENSGTTKHPMQGWYSLIPVLPTFAGTIFTPQYGEAVIYWDTARCLCPLGDWTPASPIFGEKDDFSSSQIELLMFIIISSYKFPIFKYLLLKHHVILWIGPANNHGMLVNRKTIKSWEQNFKVYLINILGYCHLACKF